MSTFSATVNCSRRSLTASAKYEMTEKNRMLTIKGVTEDDVGVYEAELRTNEGETKREYFAIRAEGP